MTEHKEKILVVDDEEQIRMVISAILGMEEYQVDVAQSGEEALEKLSKDEFGLVISDINMARMTGVELLESCRKQYPDLAVVMVTGVDDRDTAIQTLHLGAYGYVTKPFQANELIINVTNALRRRTLELENRRHRLELEHLVEERTIELVKAREESILILSKAAEFRDDETAKHTIRIGFFCEMIAGWLGQPESFCKLLRAAAPLHDVGKIGIPDQILLKPGKLTDEEFDIIKNHCRIGYRILSESTSETFKLGAEIALSHHEKYDGSGYPNGLKEEDIPLSGRIVAVCDVFDALTHKRIYKDALPIEQALEIIEKGQGSHFDPEISGLFLKNIDQILDVRTNLKD